MLLLSLIRFCFYYLNFVKHKQIVWSNHRIALFIISTGLKLPYSLVIIIKSLGLTAGKYVKKNDKNN